jgi:hypothetical protein
LRDAECAGGPREALVFDQRRDMAHLLRLHEPVSSGAMTERYSSKTVR